MDNLDLDINSFIDSLSEVLIVTKNNLLVVYSNKQAEKAFGLVKDNIVGKTVDKIIQFHDVDILNRIKELGDHEVLNFEDIVKNTDGYEYRVNIRVKRFKSGDSDYLSWIFLDYSEELETRQNMIDFMAQLNITRSKLADYAKRIEVFKEIVNNIKQGIMITDGSANITFKNTFADAIFDFKEVLETEEDIFSSFSYCGELSFTSLEHTLNKGPVNGEVLIFNEETEAENRYYLNIFSLSMENDDEVKIWNLRELNEQTEMQQQFIDFSAELTELNRQLKKKHSEILKISETDFLTNLSNRRNIIQLLESAKDQCLTGNKPMSLIIFDIDNFKKVNDTYGHLYGDYVIRAVAERSMEKVKNAGYIGRYGGEEFLIVLPGIPRGQAVMIAESIRLSIAENEFDDGIVKSHCSVTLGVTEFEEGDTIDSCITRADQALYRGKSEGKNKTEIGE